MKKLKVNTEGFYVKGIETNGRLVPVIKNSNIVNLVGYASVGEENGEITVDMPGDMDADLLDEGKYTYEMCGVVFERGAGTIMKFKVTAISIEPRR